MTLPVFCAQGIIEAICLNTLSHTHMRKHEREIESDGTVHYTRMAQFLQCNVNSSNLSSPFSISLYTDVFFFFPSLFLITSLLNLLLLLFWFLYCQNYPTGFSNAGSYYGHSGEAYFNRTELREWPNPNLTIQSVYFDFSAWNKSAGWIVFPNRSFSWCLCACVLFLK